MSNENRFHKFSVEELAGIELPRQFTFPFYYEPHPLCVLATAHLRSYLSTRKDWSEELQQGKMMGVLVAEKNDEIGYFAAFSGNLAHGNNHEYFVPAVYDLLSLDGFFPPEEAQISEINAKIREEENSAHRQKLKVKLSEVIDKSKAEIDAYRELMQLSKVNRDKCRQEGADFSALIAESQFQKAELKRIRTRWQQTIDDIKTKLAESDKKIADWKTERKQRSQALQLRIFRNFVMLNARGESRDLCEIFAPTSQGIPPAGAGECAAPKLLQYAYVQGYKPLAMAEFWVGQSPKDEIRHDGHFYPSCKAKCEPILNWMLQGLDVEPNPLENRSQHANIEVLYDDEWIVAVNKPHDMLSVPGKLSIGSLQEYVQQRYSQCDIQVVHRLDMATSGVLLFAKTKDAHKALQALFESRQVKKQYVAILDGIVETQRGIIDLPLILNPDDRPRQIVNCTHGKQAITHYEIVEQKEGKTRINFYPITGRTHQLRVHASHPNGLNAPIVGDTLYGTHASRLHLHAQSVEFIHPITHKEIKISTPCPF
ncbi:MAG: RNA pseudouridine synthase [Muribaculaceae bacterium]|nr:RNA pseudouridine synthase [Muribaculaceae bacterium]